MFKIYLLFSKVEKLTFVNQISVYLKIKSRFSQFFFFSNLNPLCFMFPIRSSMFSSTMPWWRPSSAERRRCPPGSCTATSAASWRPAAPAERASRSSLGWVWALQADQSSQPRRNGTRLDPRWSLDQKLVSNIHGGFPLPGGKKKTRLKVSLM